MYDQHQNFINISDFEDSDSSEENFHIINVTAKKEVNPLEELVNSLENAIIDDDLEKYKSLIAKNELNVTIDTQLKNGWTALMIASNASNSNFVEYLLQQGANANYCQASVGPLLLACGGVNNDEKSGTKCVKLLIESGAKTNVCDKSKKTPLIKAIEAGNICSAILLLPHSNLEMKDCRGRTAMFYAVLLNHHEIVKLLVEHGACLDIVDDQKYSINDIAIYNGNPKVLKILENLIRVPEKNCNAVSDYAITLLSDWKDMFPGILNLKTPAYWFEIPPLLYGMHCESLIPLFREANVDLSRFLSLSMNDLIELNIIFPYLRKRLKCGLFNFHTHRWSLATVPNISSKKDEKLSYISFLNFAATYMEHITVIQSTFIYINKSMNTQKIQSLPETLDNKICNILLQITNIKKEMNIIKSMAHKVNERNPLPADLITDSPESESKSGKYTRLTAVTLICCTIAIKFEFHKKIMNCLTSYLKI